MRTSKKLKKLKISTIRKINEFFPKKENCENHCYDTRLRKEKSMTKNYFHHGVELRTCKTCNSRYKAILTPVGFVEVSKL